MSVWDDPELSTGEYVTFANIGDGVAGEILSLGKHTFDDGKVAAKLVIRTDDGEEKTLTAGQVRLKLALAEKRPDVGDRINVKFSHVEKRAGGKTLKHFDVDVTRAGAPAASASSEAAPF